MQTFPSQLVTPRRTVYQRAQLREQTPPFATTPRRVHRHGGSTAASSRFATPMRGTSKRPSSARDDISEAGMSMDVDEEDLVERGLKFETLFAKSDELQVVFYAHLPAEVKLVLRNADFYNDAYSGEVDTNTGFAIIASAERCFVWNYSQALTGTPTCYIFACPQDPVIADMDPPFHALVPFGSSREPGLILMSPGGHLCFWDSLGMGLAGGTTSSRYSLGIEHPERVTTLTRADTQTYIASTSEGRLFRFTLTASGGKYQLSIHSFHRAVSSLSSSIFRLLPIPLPATQPEPAPGGTINAVAVTGITHTHDASGMDVWALIDSRIQRWEVSVEGWEALKLDEDVADRVIEPEIYSRFANGRSVAELDLELLDLKVVKNGELLVLVSFAGQEEDYPMDGVDITPYNQPQPRRIYAIVPISYSDVSGSFEASATKKVQKVPYQSTSSSGAPMHPRMQMLLNGQLIAIQFGDAVVLCAPGTEYTDRLELKSATDRTFGLGVVKGEGERDLVVLTAMTLMKVSADAEKIANFKPATGRANIIKSTMTQAILYGSHSENPLHFSFPPDVDEEALMSGAEQLSQAIMVSDAAIVRPNHDLQMQMTGRKERLSFLIKFINDNAVLTKMSQRSRQRLAVDAEKLYAAQELWQTHNEELQAGSSQSVLTEAVYMYMTSVNEGYHEDVLRAFFRLRVQDLGALLPRVLEVVRRSVYEITQSLTENLPQANEIVLTILPRAIEYREYNLDVYGVKLPLIDPWTSQVQVIDIVSELYERTAKLIESPGPDAPLSKAVAKAKKQLPELAATLFATYHERLEWLGSAVAAADPKNERLKDDLNERFKQERPVVLETLRRVGFSDEAFKLAEEYLDFRSLASLCHKDTIFPPRANPHAERIQTYIDDFKEAFTTELFQWYIEHGELRTMFEAEQEAQEREGDGGKYSAYLDRFFEEHEYPSVAWLQDLGRGRYGMAAQSLLVEAERATELSSKHLMLSIGKLSYLAQVQDSESAVDNTIIDAFHDGLDFISVHDRLLEELRSALTGAKARQSLDVQLEAIAQAKATKLAGRKALLGLFRRLARQLLQGKALSPEDAADVLSLKDNVSQVEDYITALHILVHANLPAARKLSALRCLWRRIYLHDDWVRLTQTANATDAEVNDRFRGTALYAVEQVIQSYNGELPEGFFLSPDDALPAPTSEEIASRWPGMPPDEVVALLNDYEGQSFELAALHLEDVVERVRELVAEDGSWE